MKEKNTIFELIEKPGNSWTNEQIVQLVQNNPEKSWSILSFVTKRSVDEIKNIIKERN